MKSKMKKLVSLVLAMAMVFTMSIGMSAVKVEAADSTSYTITIKNETSGYTYVAYQIFKGDLSNSTLSNVEFGSALSSDDQTALLKVYATELASYSSDAAGLAAALEDKAIDAADFAEKLAAYTLTSAGTSAYSDDDSNYTISVTGAGYYLVKNTEVPDGEDNTAYSDYILEVVKNVDVEPKSSVPTVEKKVEEKNDSTSDAAVWQDAADYDIKDSINYKLTGTMPSTLATYTTYSYVFTDTLSKGLTVDITGESIASSDVTVEVVTGDTTTTVGTSCYTVSLANYDGNESAYKDGHVLTVSFTDVLSLKDADGNDIEVTTASTIIVTYSATLNENAVVGSAGNPNEVVLTYSNNPNGDGTGTTPKDLVTVFTFNLEVKKVDEKREALKGAAFTLYKYSAEEGEYVEYATTTAGTATEFTFTGLDSGKYKIHESTTPAGYNSIADIEFEIAATYNASSDSPTLTGLVVENAANGTTFEVESTTYTKVSTTITNKSGSILPSTGGIGTTIFYIVGAILVLGAGVVLVTRRRTAR